MAKTKHDYFAEGSQAARESDRVKAFLYKEKQSNGGKLSWQEAAYLDGWQFEIAEINARKEQKEFDAIDKSLLEKVATMLEQEDDIYSEVSEKSISNWQSKSKEETDPDLIQSHNKIIQSKKTEIYEDSKFFYMPSKTKNPEGFLSANHHMDQLFDMAWKEKDIKRKNRLLNKLDKLNSKWNVVE